VGRTGHGTVPPGRLLGRWGAARESAIRACAVARVVLLTTHPEHDDEDASQFCTSGVPRRPATWSHRRPTSPSWPPTLPSAEGEVEILARARDSGAGLRPEHATSPGNPKDEVNNAWPAITVFVGPPPTRSGIAADAVAG
jgi:hypothetical protein